MINRFMVSAALLAVSLTLASNELVAPKQGGSLIAGRVTDVLNFDPTQLAPGNNIMILQLYNSLISLDEDLSPQPELAESWVLAEDARSLTLQLRDDVVFHSGRPFTARDVAFTVERYQDERIGANLRGSAMVITDVIIGGDYTLTLEFDQPQPTIFDFLDLMFVMDEETAERITTTPVGTGPFKLGSRLPGNEIVFVRNENYWKEGLPYLDEVRVRVIGDDAALAANLEGQSVHWIERPAYRDLSYLGSLPNVSVTAPLSAPNVTNLILNTANPPLDDLRVRQAIDLAIDRARYAQIYFAGYAEPIWIAPSLHRLVRTDPWYQELDRDVESARRLLSDAGHDGGLTLTMLIASDIAHSGGVTFGELVQQDLAEIGIEVRLEVSEAARYRERLFANDYDLAGHGYGRASRDPAGLLGTTVAFRPDRNLSQFYVDEYAAMVEDAVTTIDPEERTQKYRELTRYIIDQAFVLTIAPAYPFAASFDWVHGVTSNLEGWYSFEKAWVDR